MYNEKECRREIPRRETLDSRRNNDAKFKNVATMRQHFNAFRMLHQAGYDKQALRTIHDEFQNSVQFAMNEINRMSQALYDLVQE